MNLLTTVGAAIALVVLPASTPLEVVIGASVPKAGAKFEVRGSQKTTLTIRMTLLVGKEKAPLDPMKMPSSDSIAGTVTIGEADANGPKSAKFLFGKCTTVAPNALIHESAEEHPVSHKQYDAKLGEKGWSVTRPDGDPEEREFEVADMIAAHLLGTPPLAAVLKDKTLKKGDKVELEPDAAARLLALWTNGVAVKSCTLTLDQEATLGSADAVLFKAAVTLTQVDGPGVRGARTMELTGTIAVMKATGMVRSIALKGPMKITGSFEKNGMKNEIDGKGEWALEWAVKEL